MMLPWPSKHDREAAIAAARAEKERSWATAARAAALGRQIEHGREENSFAAAIARAFRGEGG